jgi:uncharacterized protein YoaH (UPF0181 family)
MARITAEQLQLLQAFLDSLPDEARGKCSICNTTLTHIAKQAEAEVGVGTATVARVLAEKINETALPADRVTAGQLRDRVRRSAGEKESGRTAQIKKLTKAEKIAAVDELIADGMREGDAIQKVAQGTGRVGRNNLMRNYMEHRRRREKEAQKAASAQDQVLIPEIVFERGKKPHKQGKRGGALLAAEQAIGVLENIADDDPDRYEAFNLVRTWMDAEVAVCSSK